MALFEITEEEKREILKKRKNNHFQLLADTNVNEPFFSAKDIQDILDDKNFTQPLTIMRAISFQAYCAKKYRELYRKKLEIIYPELLFEQATEQFHKTFENLEDGRTE